SSSFLRGQPLAQVLLALLGALAALTLRAPEEIGELAVAGSLGVLDVGLQPQRVVEALLDEPDDVVVLVLRAGDLTGLLGSCAHWSSRWVECSVRPSCYPVLVA